MFKKGEVKTTLKVVGALIVLFIIGTIFFSFSSHTPKVTPTCGQVYHDGPQVVSLVDLSNKVGKYDESLDYLLFHIQDINECVTNYSGYKHKALIYEKLAETLKLKGDSKRAAQALEKSKEAEAKAIELSKTEEKQRNDKVDKILGKK